MIIALLYTLVFAAFIFFYKQNSFFGLPRWVFVLAFLAKIMSGFFLTSIYSSHYTDRSTADIFKYYDDAKIIYNALPDRPMDYASMITGIGNDNSYYDTTYYTNMNHWYKRFDLGNYNDNHTIIRFNALIMPLSFGSFHVHTVFMCMLSFIGLFALFYFFRLLFPQKTILIYLVVFFIPSVLFWGSGVLKEGLLLFSIGGLLLSFYKLFILKTRKLIFYFLFVAALLLVLINKNYLLLVLITPLLSFYFSHHFKIKHVFLFYICTHILALALLYGGAKYIVGISPENTIVQRQKEFINLANGGIFLISNQYLTRIEPEQSALLINYNDSVKIKTGSNYLTWRLTNLDDTIRVTNSTESLMYKVISKLPRAGSLLQNKPIEYNFISFVRFAPQALYNCLLQPNIIKAKSIVERIAALENLLLILFIVICFYFGDFKNSNKPMFYFSMFSVLLLFLMIGYTTPVAGALVRYKMPLLPLMLMMGVNVLNLKRISLPSVHIFSKKTL